MDDLPEGAIPVLPPTIEVEMKHSAAAEQKTQGNTELATLKADKERSQIVVLTLASEIDDEMEKIVKEFKSGYKYSIAEAIKSVTKKLAVVAYLSDLPYKSYNSLKEVSEEIVSYDHQNWHHEGWHGL